MRGMFARRIVVAECGREGSPYDRGGMPRAFARARKVYLAPLATIATGCMMVGLLVFDLGTTPGNVLFGLGMALFMIEIWIMYRLKREVRRAIGDEEWVPCPNCVFRLHPFNGKTEVRRCPECGLESDKAEALDSWKRAVPDVIRSIRGW